MCVNSNGNQIGSSNSDGDGDVGDVGGGGGVARMFGDCFQLSWTTFSTVGYGLIFPATGASDFFVPNSCVTVGVLGSFQAFLGVVYADFCATILFSKVLRTQNNAQVFFSDPMVVRFGKKELADAATSTSTSSRRNSDDDREDTVKDEKKVQFDEEMGGISTSNHIVRFMADTAAQDDKDIPCPSLEFRLVNCLHGIPAGEIVEAKLDCVAILDPKYSKMNNNPTIHNFNSDDDTQSIISETTTIADFHEILKQQTNSKAPGFAFHSINSKQPHNFTKIKLDANEHPYFRRVWFGRHRLDASSPLLTPSARNRIKLNGGYWPSTMNNYHSIKNSLKFKHILVSLSGTSNASAAKVYAQKVYDSVDVNVGYHFVPMNYKLDDGSLKTDMYLLNAVYQQRGGGAEPFQ